MDKTLGAYSILACQKAMDDAGVTPDQIDGHRLLPEPHRRWQAVPRHNAPRPYFDPPYDSEWGLTLVNAEWLIKQMHLRQRHAPSNVPTISEMVGLASRRGRRPVHHLSGDIPDGNLKGGIAAAERTRTTMPEERANGRCPGGITGNDFINIFPHNQYYSNTAAHTMIWPFVINQHRNGLLTPWGFNATHGIPQRLWKT